MQLGENDMLMDKILDLSGPIPESLSDFNFLCTTVAREIMDIMDDGEFLYNQSKTSLLTDINPTLDPKDKKILTVYRNNIECEEQQATDREDIKVGSGSLMEASSYSPVYIIDVTVPGGLNLVTSELVIYPAVTRTEQGKVYWVPYPTVGEDFAIDMLNSMEDIEGDYGYWTFTI